MKKTTVFLAAFFSLFILSAVSSAAVPEPQSEGKFFPGKGTKAAETYEATAGAPIYDYGQGIQWGPVHFKPRIVYDYS